MAPSCQYGMTRYHDTSRKQALAHPEGIAWLHQGRKLSRPDSLSAVKTVEGLHLFRRFKDALPGHSGERERWFAFEATQLRRPVLDWLAEEEIEPILEGDA